MALNDYDAAKDPLRNVVNTQVARYGPAPSLSDTVDLTEYGVFVVVATGNITFLPVINDAADPITITGAPVGYMIPWQIRRIFATGTTATLRAVSKVFTA